ncbi:hypothetical protein FJZ26_03745 [Candidatus Parvarchaeota archaeon]|nr:hypothetical protein [Candidatus Parvarchaeota archaeon]
MKTTNDIIIIGNGKLERPKTLEKTKLWIFMKKIFSWKKDRIFSKEPEYKKYLKPKLDNPPKKATIPKPVPVKKGKEPTFLEVYMLFKSLYESFYYHKLIETDLRAVFKFWKSEANKIERPYIRLISRLEFQN